MSATGVLDKLRPFLWLALVAFLVGVLSYAAFGRSPGSAKLRVVYAPAAAPASDAWNLPKRI